MSDNSVYLRVDEGNRLHMAIVARFGFEKSDWDESDTPELEDRYNGNGSADRLLIASPEYYLKKVRRRIEDRLRKNPWEVLSASHAITE